MVPPKVRLGKVVHSEEAVKEAAYLVREGRTTEGEWTSRLENDMASRFGYRHAIACSSGTSALWLILSRMHSSALTTTPLTFAATVNAPETLGWRVKFADVESDTYGLAEKPDGFTLSVHLFGYPSRVAGDVSDACEAVGSVLPKPKYATAISFYPSHTIGVGELGAVLTDNDKLAYDIRLSKDNGRDRFSRDVYAKFLRVTLGLNLKASEVTSMLAWFQLANIDSLVRKRQEAVKAYVDLLPADLEKGRFDKRCAYLGYPIVPSGMKGSVMRELDKVSEYRCFFPCMSPRGVCPEADRLSDWGLFLPTHPYLTEDEIEAVAKAVKEGFSK